MPLEREGRASTKGAVPSFDNDEQDATPLTKLLLLLTPVAPAPKFGDDARDEEAPAADDASTMSEAALAAALAEDFFFFFFFFFPPEEEGTEGEVSGDKE